MGVLLATTLKEMEDVAVATDDALADPDTLRPTEDSSEPVALLPQLLNSLPQTCPQEESGHMKACHRDDSPLVSEHWNPLRASPTECRCSTIRLQLHF
jgi:hypothetical protein